MLFMVDDQDNINCTMCLAAFVSLREAMK